MPSKTVTAKAVADVEDVFTAPKNAVSHITGIQIALKSGSQRLVTIRDSFTTTASNGAVATSATPTRKVIYPESGKTYSWSDDTKSIPILGTCQVYADDANTNEHITILWE